MNEDDENETIECLLRALKEAGVQVDVEIEVGYKKEEQK